MASALAVHGGFLAGGAVCAGVVFQAVVDEAPALAVGDCGSDALFAPGGDVVAV